MRYKIKDFLKRIRVPVHIEDDIDYQLVTIRVNHKGVVPRTLKKGIEIGSKTMYRVSEGQFILSGIDARHGAFGIVPKELEAAVVTNDFWYFEYDETIISKEYFLYFTSTPLFANVCRIASEGTTNRVRLQASKFFDYEVWLPPVSEQKKLIEVVMKREVELNTLQTELKTQANLLSKLRQAYLQEAVMGKLTEPSQDDAKTLLADIKSQKAQLIKEGKLRKEKPLPPIKPEEIPFEIPDNWVWCRLGEICSKIGSGSTPQGSNYASEGIPFFRSQNIYDDELRLDGAFYISAEVHKQMNGTVVLAEDILLNITGGSMGRCALVPNDFLEGNVSQHVCIIRPLAMDNTFFHKLVLSPYFQKLIFSSTTGAGREGLPKYNLERFLVPIPPLSEQKAIVEKVEGLLENVSLLEKENKIQQNEVQRLMGAVLQEAFGGR